MKDKSIIHLQSGSSERGGISNYISLLVKSDELKSFNQVVTVREIKKSVQLKYKNASLEEFDFNLSLNNILAKIFLLKKICKRYSNSVIHAHALKSGFISFLLRIFFNIKYIYTNHGLRFKQKSKFNFFIFLIIEILVLLFSEKYICIRYIDYEYIKSKIRLNNIIKKISVIRLHLDIPLKVNNEKSLCKFKPPLILIGIGSLINLKRPYKFIDWINFLQKKNIPIKGYWLGEGPLKKKMIRLTKLYGLEISWKGQVDQSIIYSYLNKATFLMQPSKFEVFPTVVLESLSCGTPVISSKYWGVNELIKNGKNGLIIDDYFDNSIFQQEKLIKLFHDRDLYFSYSENCKKQFILEHNNFSKTSLKYKTLYEKVFNL